MNKWLWLVACTLWWLGWTLWFYWAADRYETVLGLSISKPGELWYGLMGFEMGLEVSKACYKR